MKFKLLPPSIFFLLLLAGIIIHVITPSTHILKAPYTYSGILFIVCGAVLDVWADHLFKIKNTTVKPYEQPSAFIRTGSFSISRHPMYFGMFLILCGETILFGSIAVLPVPFIFMILMEFLFIRYEEKTLEQIFCEEYLSYKKMVRRWI